MKNKIRLIALFFAGSAAIPALAGDATTVKCGPNQERVWVYDSLTSFDVAAKLKCGEAVEITGRVKGYVKVHTREGVDGYVPDAAFSNLPAFEDENEKQKNISVIAARRSAAPAAAPAPIATAGNVAAKPVAPAESKPAVTVAKAAPAPVAPVAEVTLTTAVETKASSPAPAPAKLPAAAPKSNPEAVHLAPVAPAPGPAPTKPAAAPAATHTTTVSAHSSSAPAKAPASAPAVAKTAASKSNPPAAGAGSSGHASQPAANPAPVAPKAVPTTTVNVTTSANVQPARETPTVHPVKATTESEDYPDFEAVSESADPNCQIFFSAYGLAPSQFKWIAQNRKKRYPNICPAPDTPSVDFVIIFTHDVDIYSTTLPSPVHTDHNGFSDFSPMSMVDNAVLSGSAADKAKRDYVWVFQMKRGAFDPNKFSPRRRPQFTKVESNSLAGHGGGPKAVEDAFHFIEGQGASR